MITVTPTETVRANIQREMSARKWTQSDLAKRAGMPQPRISEVLIGTYEPSLSKLEKIANAFGITLSALLMPVSEEKSQSVA
jgi:transcriptional regulator with XRE-family HTH domain